MPKNQIIQPPVIQPRVISIEQLYSVFRQSPDPVLLLGAGASIKSGIPLGDEIVEKAVRWEYCRSRSLDYEDIRVKRSDWLAWLKEHTWYVSSSLADNYPLVTKHLLQPKHNRKQFFLSVLNPDIPPSAGYQRLAEFMFLRLVRTVLTTNFDRVLIDLCRARKRPRHVNVIETPSDHIKLSTDPDLPQLAYIHGSVDHYTDKNDIDEIQEMDKALANRLTPILRDHPLIIVGYRGAEPSIMQHLLTGFARLADNYRHGIYWCGYEYKGPTDLHPLVHELAGTIGTNFQVVPIQGFDELMEELWGLYQHRSANAVESPKLIMKTAADVAATFDMQAMSNVDLDEVEWASMRSRMVNYCREMEVRVPTDIGRDWVVDRLCQFDLAIRDRNSEIQLTAAGYLLFTAKPQERLPAARVELKFQGEEQIVEGSLWNQLEMILNAFAEFNRPFRLKGEISETVYPYPPLSLKEVVVNALVHRSYEIDQHVVIQVESNRIIFTSPGGLVADVVRQAGDTSLQEHIKRGSRGIKGYRNPVIADLFYSVGDMDKKGSGLSDVVRLVADNGGQVEFGPIEDNTAFQVTIYSRPEAVDTVTGTATRLVVPTKFAVNLLEVLEMPTQVWYGETIAKRVRDIWLRTDRQWLPSFIIEPPFLVSFSDMSDERNPLREHIDVDTIGEEGVAELFGDSDGKNRLVWLLNESIYKHLEYRGLIVDKKRKRAYYPRANIDDGRRLVTYQARLRRPTRTVTKPIVSQTTEKVRYWEHESFSFLLEQFENSWALQLVPGYVFTTNGIARLLDGDKVTKLSTKRASRDYNSQVHNDLVFWSWVVSGGEPSSFSLSHLPRTKAQPADSQLSVDQLEADRVAFELAMSLKAPKIVLKSTIPTITVNNLAAEPDEQLSENRIEGTESLEVEEELARIAEEQELVVEAPDEDDDDQGI